MQSTQRQITARVSAALTAAFSDKGQAVDPLVKASQNPKFGDYQANCAMSLGKTLGKKPRDVAETIIQHLDLADICEPPTIAGPGFINLTLKPDFIAAQLQSVPPAAQDDRLGLAPSTDPQVVVVDLSSPNLAKEMHVGHLRSTVIGDCIARILEFDGHTVHRINHVGDWGTQFGMLVAHLRETQPDLIADPQHLQLGDLEEFYVQAKQHFDRDEAFAKTARQTVVDLQGGHPETRTIWKAFCDESLRHCQILFDRLGVKMETVGESFYNDDLPKVIQDLEKRGMITQSDGATCVFLNGFTTRDGEPLPMMVRKSDGGYNYAATDLAAIRHRRSVLGADRLIYVVGAPQLHHFKMLFAAAIKAGWLAHADQAIHLAFGSMMSADGRPFRTREGGTVKLKTLLDQAVARARSVIEKNEADDDKRRDFTAEQIAHIAETVGIAAIRYYDLSHNLTSDYRFNWDHMLAMDGNTAPYMLYAYARIKSIARGAGVDFADLPADAPIILEHPSEIGLAKALLRFPEQLETVIADLRPNLLTDYLFELSKAFNLFYDRRHGVRVKDAQPAQVRTSRLRLCDLTARTLKLGLHLLGIETVDQM